MAASEILAKDEAETMTAMTIAVTTIAEIAMKAAEKLEAISQDERPDAKRTQTMFWP